MKSFVSFFFLFFSFFLLLLPLSPFKIKFCFFLLNKSHVRGVHSWESKPSFLVVVFVAVVVLFVS